MIPMADRGHRSTRADPERGFRREALRDEVDHTASLGPHKRSLNAGRRRGVADSPIVVVDPDGDRVVGPR